MFKKILVANRGEIAVRVIRACRELGINTVAIYSEADIHSLHVKLADESYCIGPAAPGLSYLNIPRIISAAEVAGAQAIHPGYGFLSENERFAHVCQAHGITFIGPPPEAIAKMGNKSVARETARRVGLPIIPGSEGLVASPEEAERAAEAIGFPLLLKAARGGGGRGMRVVLERAELSRQYQTASAEAEAAFGSADMYMEKLVLEPRHIEIQILADQQGNVIHLGERDCSIQRRNQKLVEESPSPIMTPELRSKMGEAAKQLAKTIGYYSAGTIEFLVDQSRNFYFMEMNTRIQVEHPVTEMVTGIDLLKAQIAIAAGESLPWQQSDVVIRGHAIECRVNAEDPDREFMPAPGEVNIYLPPGGPGVRVDSHVYAGYHMLPHYDSLLAKLIVHGRDRSEAIARMRRALDEYVVGNIPTTIPFHEKVMRHSAYLEGKACTDFIPRYFSKPELLQAGKA